MLEFASIVGLRSGADRYNLLAAARLKAARLSANWTPERLADGLADVLGTEITARQIVDWEEGHDDFAAGAYIAALDVMGISEAHALGLENPDVLEVTRLAAVVVKVRGLMNDPAALMRRASELLDGRARPLLVLAVAFAVSFRMVAGPPTQQYWDGHARRAPVAAARVVLED